MIYGNYFLEDSNKRILYHASPVQGLKEIEPRRDHINPKVKQACVYASPNKDYAACFGGRWHDDIGTLSVFTSNGKRKLYFGLTDKIDITKPCSLYEIIDDGTGLAVNNYEIAFTHSMKVHKETKYKSFKDMLIKNNINVTSKEEMDNFKFTGEVPNFNNYFD